MLAMVELLRLVVIPALTGGIPITLMAKVVGVVTILAQIIKYQGGMAGITVPLPAAMVHPEGR